MIGRATSWVRRNLILAVVLLLVVSAGGSAVWAAQRATRDQEAARRADRMALARSLATLGNGYFSQLGGAEAELATAAAGTGIVPTPSLLAAAVARLPGDPTAVVVGPTGVPAIVGTGAAALASALPGLAAGLDDELAHHEVGLSGVVTLDRRPSIVIAVPAGATGAVLAVAYRLDTLPVAAYVQRLQVGAGAVALVVDAAGRRVTSPDALLLGQLQPHAGGDLPPAGTFRELGGPTPLVQAAVPVGVGGWRLVVTQPASAFYGPLWHATTVFGWGTLGVLVVVSGALLLLHARRQAAVHAIAAMALTDALTGLPNRAAFSRALGDAVARHRRDHEPVALLFCDLDGFKAINDQLGHDAGDALLVATAERIRAVPGRMRPAIPADQVSVARLGGDEFTMLLEGRAASERAAQVAEAITASLSEPFQLGPEEVCVGVSVGVAHAHPGCDLLREADVAMYRTKAIRRAARPAGSPDTAPSPAATAPATLRAV